MDKLEMKTKSISQENIEKIRALFPNAVTEIIKDGKITLAVDFDVLKQELSESLIDDKQERYQMTWPDKKKSVVLANSAISATLRPCKEESVDFDTTQNLYIEGDNLDVLKLLRETYLGKVKMIYIDPPYNTGNDFIYEDDFAQDSDEYMGNSGQYDEQGNRLVKNLDSNGRFHTDWLNMIYPRLKVAKDLLSNDGVIFISLDESEIQNAKKICDEIFGANNFICNFVRKNKAGSGHDSAYIAIEFDYALCYVKDIQSCIINQELVDTEADPKYKLTDKYIKDRGRYYLRDLDYRGSYSESLDYPIIAPDGTILYSGGEHGKPNTWRWSKQKFDWGIQNDFIVFQQKSDKSWKVYIKQYQFVDNNNNPYIRTIPYRALIDYSNGIGSMECESLLGEGIFSYPKPSIFIAHLLKIGSDKDSIILDFFSGSATTAHAVMQLNAEDGGKRKFIMVQLPEPCDEKGEAYKAGYKNICEIGKERIRRAGKKIKQELGLRNQELGNAEQLALTPNPLSLIPDIGFRVLKLDSSNMQEVFYNPSVMTQSLLDSTVDNVKPDRTAMDLLFQVMLELGVELSAKIEIKELGLRDKELENNSTAPNPLPLTPKSYTVFIVNGNEIIACFDDNLNNEVITEIAKLQPLYAVFKDKSFATDSVGINNEQIFKTYAPSTTVKVL